MLMKPALRAIAIAILATIAIGAQPNQADAFTRLVPETLMRTPHEQPRFVTVPPDTRAWTQPYKGHYGGAIGSAYLVDPRPCCAKHEEMQRRLIEDWKADQARSNRWLELHTPK